MNLSLLPDLALFVQIVEQGSFSAVARQAGATPSAISRSVSRLEQEMGCKLLHRTTRKLRLTEVGQAYYERCRQIMLDFAEAEQAGDLVVGLAGGVVDGGAELAQRIGERGHVE